VVLKAEKKVAEVERHKKNESKQLSFAQDGRADPDAPCNTIDGNIKKIQVTRLRKGS